MCSPRTLFNFFCISGACVALFVRVYLSRCLTGFIFIEISDIKNKFRRYDVDLWPAGCHDL